MKMTAKVQKRNFRLKPSISQRKGKKEAWRNKLLAIAEFMVWGKEKYKVRYSIININFLNSFCIHMNMVTLPLSNKEGRQPYKMKYGNVPLTNKERIECLYGMISVTVPLSIHITQFSLCIPLSLVWSIFLGIYLGDTPISNCIFPSRIFFFLIIFTIQIINEWIPIFAFSKYYIYSQRRINLEYY